MGSGYKLSTAPANPLFLKLIYIVVVAVRRFSVLRETIAITDLFVFDYSVEIKFTFRIRRSLYRRWNIPSLKIDTREMTISGIESPVDLSLDCRAEISGLPLVIMLTLIIHKETIAFREIIMWRRESGSFRCLPPASLSEWRTTATVYTAEHSICRKNKPGVGRPNIIVKTFNASWINSRGEYSVRRAWH